MRAADEPNTPPSLQNNADSPRWRSYLQRVYRSEEPLPASTARGLLERAFWFYHSAPFDGRVECFHQQESALNTRQVCAVRPSGLRIVIRHRPQPESLLARFGFFLPATRPGTCRRKCPIVPPAVPAAAATKTTTTVSGVQQVAPRRTQCPIEQLMAADHSWVEVTRIAERSFFPRPKKREGGALGCWFFAAAGSGVFLNVGRSLRVTRREDLAAALNMTNDVLRQAGIDRKFFEVYPYSIDPLGLCGRAAARGYDSLQIWDEDAKGHRLEPARYPDGLTHLTKLWEHEVVSCNPNCLASNGPCTRLPLRTGVDASRPCACNDARPVLNCDRTAPHLPPSVANGTERAASSSAHVVRAGLECARGRGPDHLQLADIFPVTRGAQRPYVD